MSMFRINNNISSINAQRNLEKVSRESSKTLEHLSSGQKINIGADGPAALVISETMRAQVSGLSQAIENSEQGISMVQTAEGSLNEVNKLLTKVRQLAIHAANEGVNDETMLAADQAEIQNAMDTIDRISQSAQFGNKLLLDGSRGANGVANGEGLEFVEAGLNTKNSPVEGYSVSIDQLATRSSLTGSKALTQDVINAGETLTVSEGGRTVSFTTREGESVESTLNEFENRIERAGLNVELLRDKSDEGTTVTIQHKEFGSKHGFSVASTTAGILSDKANVQKEADHGQDVAGTINGEEAVGDGQILKGKEHTQNIEGLSVRYTVSQVSEEGEAIGTVSVFQNSLKFQVGANEGQTVSVSLRNMAPRALSRGVDNESGFRSLSEIDVTTFQGSQDALKLIDKAIAETTTERGTLGAFQQNTLQSNLNSLRIASENVTAAESVIRDADMAKEMTDFTKNQILTESSTAMLAQANQQSSKVLSLLR